MDISNINLKQIGEELRLARVALGHTQLEAALTIKVREETYRRWESGRIGPSWRKLEEVLNYVISGKKVVA